MLPITASASKILDKILASGAGKEHFKIDNSGGVYMALVVEVLPSVYVPYMGDCKQYSLAHYYEQNGDLMADPEMVVLEAETGLRMAYSFKMDGLPIYREAIDLVKGTYYPTILRDNTTFFSMWMQNIKHQQNLKP